jgi:hypothetical protein
MTTYAEVGAASRSASHHILDRILYARPVRCAATMRDTVGALML